MFGIGIPELIIIVVVLLVIVAGVIVLFRALIKSQSPSPLNKQYEILKELQKMKNGDLINENEFNEKRNQILGNL